MRSLSSLQKFALKSRRQIIIIMQAAAFLLAGLIIFGGALIIMEHAAAIEVMLLGADLGKVSLVFYISTLLPGIFRRFKISNPLITILSTFRRQIGVLTYLFAFGHYFLMRGALQLKLLEIFSFQTFELMGTAAILLLTPLFITSNDLSVRKLGKNWKKIHKLTYFALFFIVLHTILQDISVWSITAAIVIAAELASGIYSRISKQQHIQLQ